MFFIYLEMGFITKRYSIISSKSMNLPNFINSSIRKFICVKKPKKDKKHQKLAKSYQIWPKNDLK